MASVTYLLLSLDLAPAHQQAWFKSLDRSTRDKVLDGFYQDPSRAQHGLYKTKMCAKYAEGKCLRGNHNAKPQASGVR